MRALTRLLAEKDESTEEHTRRVALRAVQVGEELGLPPGRLRDLAIGGLLHDIGKLSVPERILKKPGALTTTSSRRSSCTPSRGVSCCGSSAASPGVHDSCSTITSGSTEDGYPRGLQEAS